MHYLDEAVKSDSGSGPKARPDIFEWFDPGTNRAKSNKKQDNLGQMRRLGGTTGLSKTIVIWFFIAVGAPRRWDWYLCTVFIFSICLFYLYDQWQSNKQRNAFSIFLSFTHLARLFYLFDCRNSGGQISSFAFELLFFMYDADTLNQMILSFFDH
jgi:hypothetical protein